MFLLFLLILVVLAIFTVVFIIKKVAKVAFVLGVIFIVLFFITRGAVLRDFNQLSDNIQGSPNMVLLENKGEIVAGFIKGEKIILLDDFALINELYNKNDLKEIKGDNYKLFVLNLSLIGELERIGVNNKPMTYEEISDFFVSDVSIDSITFEDLALKLDFEEGSIDMKSAVFAYLYETEFKMTKSPLLFFKNYKDGAIKVYPETMFFRFSKFIPLGWIDEKLNKLKDAVTEKAKESVNSAVTSAKDGIKGAMD